MSDRSISARIADWTIAAVAIAVLIFIACPVLIVIPMSFSGAEALEFPPTSFSLRWYRAVFTNSVWAGAFKNTFFIGFASSTISLVIGSLAAYAIVRAKSLGMRLLEMNFLAPMLVPDIIVAISLFISFAQFGLVGTYPGLILGHVIRSAPFVVLVVGIALKNLGETHEIAAFSLGASRWFALTRITAPMIAPSLVTAWVLALLVSFDEVIVTNFLAGSYETVAKRMFTELTHEISPAITAISSIMVFLTITLMASVAWLLWRSKASREVAQGALAVK